MLPRVSVAHFFLLLSSVPFSGCTTSICLPTDRHLGCFQLLAVISRATHMLYKTLCGHNVSFISGKYLEVSRMAVLYGKCLFVGLLGVCY